MVRYTAPAPESTAAGRTARCPPTHPEGPAAIDDSGRVTQRCPPPGSATSPTMCDEMSESRCPFPHDAAPPGDDERWTEQSRRHAEEMARARAPHSHIDAERAAAMATRAVESRAEDRSLQRIDAAFI